MLESHLVHGDKLNQAAEIQINYKSVKNRVELILCHQLVAVDSKSGEFLLNDIPFGRYVHL